MSDISDMIARPPSYPMPDWEYQIRRNALIPEAYQIADDFANSKFGGVEPPNTDVVAYRDYTNLHQRKYFRTMNMLWDGKYGGM